MIRLAELHEFYRAQRTRVGGQPLTNRGDSKRGGLLNRVTVNSRTDGGEAYAFKRSFPRQVETFRVAQLKQIRLTMSTIAIHRTDRVKYVLCRESSGAGHDRATSG